MNALIAEIRQHELTPRSAAKLLGVTQRRASDLLRGNIHLFTVDALMMMARAAGIRVDFQIKRPRLERSRRRPGIIRIEA